MTAAKPKVGLSVMPEPEFLAATLPLFEDGQVATIEWSFDMSWKSGLPPWLAGLLADYGQAGLLTGHGVSLSPLSNHDRQDHWHRRFAEDAANHSFTHVSEHFGFMAAGEFHRGPPLPIPMTSETLATGQAHLQRLAETSGVRVGLENLALAFCVDDVMQQGEFLDHLLEPVDGYVVLDVHNLWCQLHNFEMDAEQVLATYPLGRVTECHISGGSWTHIHGRDIRRDTHDDNIPAEALELLALVLGKCPAAATVIVERLGHTLGDPGVDERFRRDYQAVIELVETTA